jgi:hypothetical protein
MSRAAFALAQVGHSDDDILMHLLEQAKRQEAVNTRCGAARAGRWPMPCLCCGCCWCRRPRRDPAGGEGISSTDCPPLLCCPAPPAATARMREMRGPPPQVAAAAACAHAV